MAGPNYNHISVRFVVAARNAMKKAVKLARVMTANVPDSGMAAGTKAASVAWVDDTEALATLIETEYLGLPDGP